MFNLFKKKGFGIKKRIYFDNASAVAVEDKVLKKYLEIANRYFANASSIHREGEEVKNILFEARKRVAKCIKAKSNNIYFTSSATEGNNIFIKGVVMNALREYKSADDQDRINIIYTKSDHSSIVEVTESFTKNIFINKVELTNISLNKIGILAIDDILKNLNSNTKLICFSYVNSETGTMQDVKKIVQEVRKHWDENFKNTCFPKIFIDASQAVKYYEMDVHNLGVDGISFGLSKIGGVAGAAVLWVKTNTKLESIVSGGGQEDGIRSGTENIAAIVANSYLLQEICTKERESKKEKIFELRNYLIKSLQENFQTKTEKENCNLEIFGDTKFKYNKYYEHAAPHILLISLKNMLGEELCLRLDAKNISVSPATACSLLENSGSNFLKAIGEPIAAKETIRISFSEKNTKDEIDYFVKVLKDIQNKFIK